MTPTPPKKDNLNSNYNGSEEKQKRNVILLLENQHYNYVDLSVICNNQPNEPRTEDTGIKENKSKSNQAERIETVVRSIETRPIDVPWKSRPALILPYTSESNSRHIKKLAEKYLTNNNFRICFKSRVSIKQFLRKQNETEPKKTTDQLNLETSGTVYQLTCKLCRNNGTINTYIGETGRPLVKRLKEHCKNITPDLNPTSNVSQVALHAAIHHGKNDQTQWDIRILTVNPRTQRRKVEESKYINEYNPNLNITKGISLII